MSDTEAPTVTVSGVIDGRATEPITFTPKELEIVAEAADALRQQGKVATRVTTPKPEPGQLPEAILDTFRQYYGAGSHHQFDIGRVVDDAIAECAGKLTANQIIKAAAKEMDLSRSQVLKCRDTWAATDEQLRAEFDMLTFEHFAALRFVGDRAKVRGYLELAVNGDNYGGRFMPAVKLAAKVKKDLGLEPPPPTPGELLDRAIKALENYQAVAEGRQHAQATAFLEGLRKINQV